MTIPSITPYSGTLPQRSDPANFPTNADDFVAWQEGTLAPDINATVEAMNEAVALILSPPPVVRTLTAANYTTNTGTSLDASAVDLFIVTAQAGPLLFNDPSGTPLEGQALLIRIKDNGTARVLTYGAQFRAIGASLPTTTVISKTLYIGSIWNSTDSKWDVVAVKQEV